MLRTRIPDWIWGLLLGIVATAVIGGATLGYLPSPKEIFGDAWAECRQAAINSQQKTEPSHSAAQTNGATLQNGQSDYLEADTKQQKNNYDCLIAQYTGSLAVFTKLLVIVTLLLALFGFWQVMVSRDTARRQLRAYVAMVGGVVTQAIVTNKAGFVFRVELKNFGLTPSYNFSTWHRVEICDVDKPPQFIRTGPTTNNGVSIIGPGCSANLEWAGVFSDDDRTKIREKSKAIFAWGRADYVDAFGSNRRFVFRCIMTGPENQQGLWALAPYKTGYEAN